MPALFTSTSRRPNASSADCTIPAAAFSSETSADTAMASPPSASISFTTCSAGSDDDPDPSRFTP